MEPRRRTISRIGGSARTATSRFVRCYPDMSEQQTCRECGGEIEHALGSKWSAAELQVCESCWWTELDGDERREIAKEANA